MMLPLEPDAGGNYSKASFLTAGGTPSAVAPSPGTPLGTNLSRIDTVTLGPTGSETLSSESTGPLRNARWYPSGVLLPNGQVMAFSGADIDEVQAPSLGRPVKQAEWSWAEDARAQGQDLTVAAAVADPTAPPEWAPAAGTQTYSWLEFRGLYERDRPPRRVLDARKTAVLRAWTVPLEQDGRRVELRGETVWKPVSRAGD
jgi:hypothetical protein